MPAWDQNAGGLTNEEIEKIISYLQDVTIPSHSELEPKMIQGAQDPSFKVIGNVSRGEKIFNKHCAACHLSGLAPDVFNPTFQKTATDGFVFSTILQGRKNTPMSGFFAPSGGGFGPEEISDLTAYIRNTNSNSAKQVSYNEATNKGE
jgi:mono/diheme cytochrome c family protein